MILIMTSFSHCSSAQKLQEKAPFELNNAYFQQWVAGIKGGGSGLNLFIPLKEDLPKKILLDSVYFRGEATKLEAKLDNSRLFVGSFDSESNQKEDIIMSNEPHAEYGNKPPKLKSKIPYELKGNECVVSYIEGKRVKYFKIENVVEKQIIQFPGVKPKN